MMDVAVNTPDSGRYRRDPDSGALILAGGLDRHEQLLDRVAEQARRIETLEHRLADLEYRVTVLDNPTCA